MYLTVNEMELLPSPKSQGDLSNTPSSPRTKEQSIDININTNTNTKQNKLGSRSSEFGINNGKRIISGDRVYKDIDNVSNISSTPFDNFQQEAYYITGCNNLLPNLAKNMEYNNYNNMNGNNYNNYYMNNDAFYDYQGIYHSDVSSAVSMNIYTHQCSATTQMSYDSNYKYDDIAFHYLSQNMVDTEFVHYSSSDQLSLKDINDDINLETISYPFEPEDYSVSQLLLRLADVEQDVFLSQHGYKKEEILCDTIQGQLIKCKRVESNMMKSSSSLTMNSLKSGMKKWLNGDCSSAANKANEQDINGYVAIKKTDKSLFNQRISKQDNGFNICVEENIKREAQILKYLTIDNKSTEYITKYIDFFESETDYYLVMEYVDGKTNLKDFIKKAHQYINDGKLSLKDYQKIIKYIFWQISAVLHWLHNDMHCMSFSLCIHTQNNIHFIYICLILKVV